MKSFCVFVSKSKFNLIPLLNQTNEWKYFPVFVSQKLCIFSGLKFIVYEPFNCFCVSVHCDSHRIIFFESISLFYIFGIFIAIWKITNTIIFIHFIFCKIIIIDDSDRNIFCNFDYFHMKSELNIENNFPTKFKKCWIIIYFCESFPIEIEIFWYFFIFAFLH